MFCHCQNVWWRFVNRLSTIDPWTPPRDIFNDFHHLIWEMNIACSPLLFLFWNQLSNDIFLRLKAVENLIWSIQTDWIIDRCLIIVSFNTFQGHTRSCPYFCETLSGPPRTQVLTTVHVNPSKFRAVRRMSWEPRSSPLLHIQIIVLSLGSSQDSGSRPGFNPECGDFT